MPSDLLQLFPTEQSPVKITTVVLKPVEELAPTRYTAPAPFPAETFLTEESPVNSSDASSHSSDSDPDKELRSSKKPILGKIYAALLILAACGAGCYEFAPWVLPSSRPHKSEAQNSAPVLDPQTVTVTATPEAQTPVATNVPAKLPKPSPGKPLNSVSNLSQTTTAPLVANPQISASTQPSAPSEVNTKSTPIALHQAANAPTPIFVPRPMAVPAPQPVAAKSGVLHYQGRPIPYGGVVAFNNLPTARLRYSFDRSSWRISLTNNPDGSRKSVLLTSIKQGTQTNCDLGWEILQ